MNQPLRALVFDVDGTLADTERFHLRAFNEAFAAEGLPWHWDEALYTELLAVSGGKERLQAWWRRLHAQVIDIDGHAVPDLIERLHDAKTAAYEAMVNEGLVELRPGVLALMEQAGRHGLQLAIATTTSPVNVAALLRRALGPQWRLLVPVVGDGESAPRKKPHPQVYLQVLARLGLPAPACLAFEDSANGLRAARAAGIDTVVTPTAFTRDHDFGGALQVLPSLAGVGVDDLLAWRERAHAAQAVGAAA